MFEDLPNKVIALILCFAVGKFILWCVVQNWKAFCDIIKGEI